MSAAITVWRIATDTSTYTAEDLSGKGAEITGGRWNRVRTPMVYAAASRALACLETVVHLAPASPLPLNRYLVDVNIPLTLWSARAKFDPAGNVGWDAEPAGIVSLDWGTNWAKSNASAIAVVPSVIVPEEIVYLVNPAHPDAGQVTAVKTRKWLYDYRLGGS